VIDREIINESGNILIQTSSKELLILSKILALASPVFKAMLNLKFLEGITIRSVHNPLELPLPDDDPDALAVLFYTLHFSSQRKFPKLGADLQLDVTYLSDKYDCITSIYGESGRWLRSLSESESDHESPMLWKLSTIAFLIGHVDEFSNLTTKLVLNLTAAELNRTTPNSALPETLKGMSGVLSILKLSSGIRPNAGIGALHRLRTRVVCDMMGEAEEAIDGLRHDQQEFETGGKLCTACKRYKPPPTKKCHNCRNDEFLPLYCDAGSRVCEFLGVLSSANVWPLSRQMEDSAVAFQSKLESIQSRLHHNYNGYNRCPLSQAAKTLKDKVGRVLTQSEGLDLRVLQRNI